MTTQLAHTRLINIFLGRLELASAFKGEISESYQLGYFRSLLTRLVEVPGVADVLLDDINTLNNIASANLRQNLGLDKAPVQKSVEVSTPSTENRNMIKTQNTQYKKTLRNELAQHGVELRGGYYNDTFGSWTTNKTTSRRIKCGISRKLTPMELGTLEAALGNEFDCKIDAKNYDYWGPTVVLSFRKRK